MTLIRLGTRASALARWQADWVAARLRETGVTVEMVPITTTGDTQKESIKKIGAQGLFTKEIQQALLEDRIDLAVHSLKDLPTERVPGLMLAVVPKRAPVRDALIARSVSSFDNLPEGATVGTGSLRRQAQLLCARPDLDIRDIRGNLDTRLAKLDRGDFDAILLAEAGLRRLGWADRITEVLPDSLVLPAVGQGALGLETREDDLETRGAIKPLDHPPTHAAVVAERSMLQTLRGGCLAPIAAWGREEDETNNRTDSTHAPTGSLTLTGRVLSADGSKRLEATQTRIPRDAVALGVEVAEALLLQGAGPLIDAARI